MSLLIAVAVRDSAMNQYARPFFVPTIPFATRSFTQEVNRAAEDNQMNRHPEDFELYTIGTYDEETGRLEPNNGGPALILRAKDIIQRTE